MMERKQRNWKKLYKFRDGQKNQLKTEAFLAVFSIIVCTEIVFRNLAK